MKRMGINFSEPIPNFGEDLGYLAIVVRCRDRIRLLHAPKSVVEMVQGILRELAGSNWHGCQPKEDYGAITFRLPGQPFRVRGGKKNATLGKLFMVRLLEEMYKLGYHFIASSKLSRTPTDHSTLLFRKVCAKRIIGCRVLCISPGNDFLFGFGSNDKIILIRCPQNVYLAIQEAIHVTSKFEVQCETSFTYRNEEVIEVKLTGEPWAALEEEFSPSRRLLVEITKRIKDLNWKFLGTTNLKGSYDALFFLQTFQGSGEAKEQNELSSTLLEENSPTKEFSNINVFKKELSLNNQQMAVVSLNGKDKLRFLDFRDPEIVPIITWTISHLYDSEEFKPIIGDYFGSTEFVLPDTPFYNEEEKSSISTIRSRTMICAIMSALNSRGWEVHTTFDSPPTSQNLSVLLMSRCSPCVYPYACISMSGSNQLNFVAFRPSDCETLKMIAHQAYAPGIDYEEEFLDSSDADGANPSKSVSFILKGQPWTDHSAYSCHGKSMLLLLLVKAEILGWRLVSSISTSNKTIKIKKNCCRTAEIPADVDSWFFRFVGESQRPFKQQKAQDYSFYNDCNGRIHEQKHNSLHCPMLTGNHEDFSVEDKAPALSTNNALPTYNSNLSSNHSHDPAPDMSYLDSFASSKNQLSYNNGVLNSTRPTSFDIQEEKLMTTLV